MPMSSPYFSKNGGSGRPPARKSAQPNTSILKFFKKVDGPRQTQNRITDYAVRTKRGENGSSDDTDALFFEEQMTEAKVTVRSGSPDDAFAMAYSSEDRYHELGGSFKRQRVDSSPQEGDAPSAVVKPKNSSPKRLGPFVDNSDSEDDLYGEQSDGEKLAPPLTHEPEKEKEPDRWENSADELFECSPDTVSSCPICEESLVNMDEAESSLHVNNCLDGTEASISNKENLDRQDTNTAFSKLASGNAEAAAWVTATQKKETKGNKLERKCPFYKILPGFSICVDAFRYGTVEGCNAYFLSHFHSDHYMGLGRSWNHGPIFCSKITGNLVRQQLKVDPKWIVDIDFHTAFEVPGTNGVRVTMIPANHCPGSSLFLFEKAVGTSTRRILHCGDFRAHPSQIQHPSLNPGVTGKKQSIDVLYLDTTYLNPKYSFPNQDDVVFACTDKCVSIDRGDDSKGIFTSIRRPGKLLVVVGTYSIGKERICVAIAQALDSKIYVSPPKKRVCNCLDDPVLSSLLTGDPLQAQVHMQPMMEMRADTLANYLAPYKPRFSRVVGFRPTGWNYRPPAGRTPSPDVPDVLHSHLWRPRFDSTDLTAQRGSTAESTCFAVPYSEHSSFRELTMFVCALPVGRIVPTVNVGSECSRANMNWWFQRWDGHKRRHGLLNVDGWTRW